ncbi:unnamed protein product [Coffea canephora]|uniref:Uncharacterized protein n=1 Tax=Coffea canephora TaxID=49390 RepID=A0A068URA9_COFCA|nr:unnamed protein product [Coffea canephora]
MPSTFNFSLKHLDLIIFRNTVQLANFRLLGLISGQHGLKNRALHPLAILLLDDNNILVKRKQSN